MTKRRTLADALQAATEPKPAAKTIPSRRGKRAWVVYLGRDPRGDAAQLADIAVLAPGQEAQHPMGVSSPGVRIRELGGEEFVGRKAGTGSCLVENGGKGGGGIEAGGKVWHGTGAIILFIAAYLASRSLSFH